MTEENAPSLELDDYINDELDKKEVYVNPGELYVVATPIGRIVDITLRAIKVLDSVDLIAAEDTRRSYILLNILGIKKQVISNQKFNEYKKTEYFISALRDGKSVAVISDAGTPCISDPGNELIKRAIDEGFKVNPIPGACAAVTGLSASGFDLTGFVFRGFFPKENTEKREEMLFIKKTPCRTFVYYESPKRIMRTMQYLADEDSGFKVCLCNDLTKTHERFYRGTPFDVLSELNDNPNAEKGEFTLIIESPAKGKENDASRAYFSPEAALIDTMLENGVSPKEAIDIILEKKELPFRKNELKEAAINLKSLK